MITSIAVVMIYLAYLLVTVPMLVSRLSGRWPLPADGTEPPASSPSAAGACR